MGSSEGIEPPIGLDTKQGYRTPAGCEGIEPPIGLERGSNPGWMQGDWIQRGDRTRQSVGQ